MTDEDKPFYLWDADKGEPTPAQIDAHVKKLRPPSFFKALAHHFKRISESDEYDDEEDKYQGLMLTLINLMNTDYESLKRNLVSSYKRDRKNSPWVNLSIIDQIVSRAIEIGMASEKADARHRFRRKQAEIARKSDAKTNEAEAKDAERQLTRRVADGARRNSKGEIMITMALVNKINSERAAEKLASIGKKTVQRHLKSTENRQA